jgi:hypothetical protein
MLGLKRKIVSRISQKKLMKSCGNNECFGEKRTFEMKTNFEETFSNNLAKTKIFANTYSEKKIFAKRYIA